MERLWSLFGDEAGLVNCILDSEPKKILDIILQESNFTDKDIEVYKKNIDKSKLSHDSIDYGTYFINEKMLNNVAKKIAKRSVENRCEHMSLILTYPNYLGKKLYLSKEIAKGIRDEVTDDLEKKYDYENIGVLHTHLGNKQECDLPTTTDFGCGNANKKSRKVLTAIVRPENKEIIFYKIKAPLIREFYWKYSNPSLPLNVDTDRYCISEKIKII